MSFTLSAAYGRVNKKDVVDRRLVVTVLGGVCVRVVFSQVTRSMDHKSVTKRP